MTVSELEKRMPRRRGRARWGAAGVIVALVMLAVLAPGFVPDAPVPAALADRAAPVAVASVGGHAAADVDAGGGVRAGVDDFSFASMDVEYELGRADDGTSTLRVTETFVALFPDFDQNRGMRRVIPSTYLGAPLFPELLSITDADGNPRASETESEDDYFSMTSRADDYVHGAQTYVFTYTLANVTRYFADTGVDEFYWNVNGTQWDQSFGRVSARLTLAPELTAARTGEQACYVGSAGSGQTCDIGDDGEAVVASARELSPHQTMTIAVGFEKGTFTAFDSSVLASPWAWLQGFALLALIGALVWAAIVRARYLRDAPGRATIIAEYTPPEAVDALESAVLLGLTTKAIPAEVLEQAVVGSIRIIEGEKKTFGGSKLIAELIDRSKADGDGRMLLDGLFPNSAQGEQFEFGRSDIRFSKAAQSILNEASQELVDKGLRRTVGTGVRAWPILLAIVASGAVMVFGILALANYVDLPLPLTLIIAAVPVMFIAIGLVVRKPLTAAGAEARDHLKGLKEFIEWAEADRVRMLQSPRGAERVSVDTDDPRQMLALYERLLPFAVVFGQEKEWAKELAVLYGAGNSPLWYVGAAGFDASSFSSGISTLSASTASSSTGGSSGGGSAGGGGGGGGGGGV